MDKRDKTMSENGRGLVDIGALILKFAKVNRVTFWDDGVTRESDTDHTMMLCTSACALAQKLYPSELDLGLIAQLSIVHDLVEAYADDTDSFGITEEAKEKKEKREHEAYLRIENEFKDTFPWIPEMIAKYEALDSKEARFVKTVDKIMNKITHIHNTGAYFKSRNLDREHMWKFYGEQTKIAEEKYGKEFPELLALNQELMEEASRKAYGS